MNGNTQETMHRRKAKQSEANRSKIEEKKTNNELKVATEQQN